MFSRILIANRGEIALRIIRTCRRLGIETVAVYSQADKDAVYLRLANQALCIGGPSSAESYLNKNNIISAAEISDVEAIHPGYGFLSENARFAEMCRACKIAFIGPPTEVIDQVGDKVQAKRLAQKAKVPVVPGSPGVLENEDEALAIAAKIGYPVILKAAAGGGGRGMRIARNDRSLIHNFGAAKQEAHIAFGNGDLYMEKYIEKMRHVEVQILADEHGNIVHLGERDCTVQRRNQKLIEESPCPLLDKRTRFDIQTAAVKLMKTAGYTNAGTVEFIYDLTDKKFYFMEINARLQVEHPVTEMVTGLDLVEEQLRIATGEPLRYKQRNIPFRGHAIECRINAEDPTRDFAPAPGRVTMFCPPTGRGIRLDSHLYTGYQVPPYYDSMLGKMVVLDRTRNEALQRMRRALDELVLEGLPTTVSFLREVCGNTQFVEGNYDTGFIGEFIPG